MALQESVLEILRALLDPSSMSMKVGPSALKGCPVRGAADLLTSSFAHTLAQAPS